MTEGSALHTYIDDSEMTLHPDAPASATEESKPTPRVDPIPLTYQIPIATRRDVFVRLPSTFFSPAPSGSMVPVTVQGSNPRPTPPLVIPHFKLALTRCGDAIAWHHGDV